MPGLNNAGVNLPSAYSGFRSTVWQDRTYKSSPCPYPALTLPSPGGRGGIGTEGDNGNAPLGSDSPNQAGQLALRACRIPRTKRPSARRQGRHPM